MNYIKTDISNTITNLRAQLYAELTTPIDAMWELLYVASSQHYVIKQDATTIGYCCINENQCLLQIFLLDAYKDKMELVLKEMVQLKLIKSASLSSKEPTAFNACLLLSKEIKENTFCYANLNIPRDVTSSFEVELVTTNDIPAIKIFLKEELGMDDTFGYTENLVSRKEFYMVKESDVIIATSECRMSDTQTDIADIGIIVRKANQGKGVGADLMQLQVNRVLNRNRRPICSTTIDNIASQKIIAKSGFYTSNIIFDIKLTDM